MSNNRNLFHNFSKVSKSKVKVGDGTPLEVEGSGDIVFKNILPNKKVLKCTLKNVLYVPNLVQNLISVSQ